MKLKKMDPRTLQSIAFVDSSARAKQALQMLRARYRADQERINREVECLAERYEREGETCERDCDHSICWSRRADAMYNLALPEYR